MKLNNKQDTDDLCKKMDAVLGPLGAQLGLTKIKVRRITYDADGLSASITVKVETLADDGKTREETDFIRLADMYGLKPEWLHQSFQRTRGETVEIIGLLPARSKFPIVVKDANKGRFLITIEEVQRKLGGEPFVQRVGRLELVPPPPRTR